MADGQKIGALTPWSDIEAAVRRGDPAAEQYARRWLATEGGRSSKIVMPNSLREFLSSKGGAGGDWQ